MAFLKSYFIMLIEKKTLVFSIKLEEYAVVVGTMGRLPS